MKGLGNTQQTLTVLGVLVAASAVCALAARFSASTEEASIVAAKLAA